MRYSRNMNGDVDLITVYRSGDSDADSDVAAVHDFLAAKGMNPVIVDDKAPGVVPGTREVRVPTSQFAEAESLMTTFDPDEPMDADPSHDLDMVTITRHMGATGEMEAIGVRSVLEAAGIPVFMFGQSTLPNLSFHVRVPRTHVDQAKTVLAEAEAAGPAAAAEAERESEALPPADA